MLTSHYDHLLRSETLRDTIYDVVFLANLCAMIYLISLIHIKQALLRSHNNAQD